MSTKKPSDLTHPLGASKKSAETPPIEKKTAQAYQRMTGFFSELKRIAQQLTPLECWCRILAEAMKKYLKGDVLKPPDPLLLSA